MPKKLTTEEFIEKARKVHGDKYDYSNVKYTDSLTKVCIICNRCGREFWQTPANHLRGQGCAHCNKSKPSNKDEFVRKSIEVHGNKYNYSLVEYINSCTKVKIICPIHGVFEQTPAEHLYGSGCHKCRASCGEKK